MKGFKMIKNMIRKVMVPDIKAEPILNYIVVSDAETVGVFSVVGKMSNFYVTKQRHHFRDSDVLSYKTLDEALSSARESSKSDVLRRGRCKAVSVDGESLPVEASPYTPLTRRELR